jgi:hypothetical protein
VPGGPEVELEVFTITVNVLRNFLRVGYWMNGIGVAGTWIQSLVSFAAQA